MKFKQFVTEQFVVARWWFYLIGLMVALDSPVFAIAFLLSFELSSAMRKSK